MSEKRMVTIYIDGDAVEAEEGRLLLPLLLEEGYDVPYFCYHEALGPDGNCRMCMGEIEGSKRPQISCDTFVEEGMKIATRGEKIESVRRIILELELINHPVDCPICDQAGECALQDYYMEYGLYDGGIEKEKKRHMRKHIELGANVIHDRERCVLCQRCVRFCRDISKSAELCVIGRGSESYIGTVPGRRLENDYAMNVVDLCPVGALTSADFRFSQRVWFLESTPSVCRGCDRNCSIYIDHHGNKFHEDRIYRYRPRRNDEVNGFFICDEGRMSYKEAHEKRLGRALHMGEEISIAEASSIFTKIVRSAGGKMLVIADANLSLEELEALNSFASEFGASIHSPLREYIDESFADDWLRSAMRGANAEAVRRIGMEVELPKSAKGAIVLNVNTPFADSIADSSLVVDISTHEDKLSTSARLVLPMAHHSERDSIMINRDGILQYCPRALNPSEPLSKLEEWLSGVAR